MRRPSAKLPVDKLGTSTDLVKLKADAHLQSAIEAFLLSRQVANCTSRTLGIYRANLQRFAQYEGATLTCDTLLLQRYLTGLRDHMQPITTHNHFRPLRTFFRWCVESGLLSESPMRSITMRLPKTLPHVPEDETVRKLLVACPDTFEGRRNRVLVALLADFGLRISEALRLRVEDIRLGERTIAVHQGKGSKDGVAFMGAETT